MTSGSCPKMEGSRGGKQVVGRSREPQTTMLASSDLNLSLSLAAEWEGPGMGSTTQSPNILSSRSCELWRWTVRQKHKK